MNSITAGHVFNGSDMWSNGPGYQYYTRDLGTSSQGMQRDPKRLSQPREPQLIGQFVAMVQAVGSGLHIKEDASPCSG